MRLKIAPIRVLRWNKELSKFRSAERKKLNRAKKTNTLSDWARSEEAQRIYKRAIVVAKRDSWKTLCKSIESAPKAFSLHRSLSKETNAHVGYPSFLMAAIPSRWRRLNLLMEVQFPGFQGSPQGSRERQRIRVKYNPWAWELAAKVVYSCEVGWAINHSKPTRLREEMGYIPLYYRRGLVYY